MARLPLPFIVTFAVVFFSLTLSHARIPTNIVGDDVTVGQLPSSLSESDVNPIIRLPTDAESHSNEHARETSESEPSTDDSVPLSAVRFVPVDRRFRLRSRFPSRCRHHHHHDRMFMPVRQHREIPYGDDMILTGGENADFDQGMFRGGVRQIPARWVKFQHHDDHHNNEDEDDEIPKFMFKHSNMFDKEKFKKHKHHHHDEDDEEDKEERFKEHKHHHDEDDEEDKEERFKEDKHHHHDEDDEEDDEEDKEEKFKEHKHHHQERFKEHKKRKEEGGFMERIRKILDHF